MTASEGPATRTGPTEAAAAKLTDSDVQGSPGRRQLDPVIRADWAAEVTRQPLSLAARTVAGQLADRAREGRVRATPAEIAACACLRVGEVYAALADLGSRSLVGQDDRGAYVLTLSAGRG